jgi:phosphoribosylaminoimidazolecarboxamide formyltransferase/IMP cyclohydrolase
MQTADNNAGLADLRVVGSHAGSAGTCCLPAVAVRQVQRHRVCAGGMTLGVGAGQMSRIDSAHIASISRQRRFDAGAHLWPATPFPLRDGLDVVVDAGATCVIQPGGVCERDDG